jgi:hypothetical protein
METEQLYDLLVSQLLNRIPDNIKRSSYLMELLGIGRESVYRRIRGEIPFTTKEILQMAVALNVSIDKVIDGEEDMLGNDCYQLKVITNREYIQIFQSSLHQFYDLLLRKESKEVIVALNYFHPIFLGDFNLLFKFCYYRLLCQNNDALVEPCFSKINISAAVNELKLQIAEEIKMTKKTNVILDCDIFLRMIKDIQYFHQKKLITDEEKYQLKEELSNLIDVYEQLTKTGIYGINKLSVYLSSYLSVHFNRGLTRWNDDHYTLFRFDTMPRVIIIDTKICALQKAGLEYLKRQSICITQSNEILQSEFFNLQRQHITAF